MAHRANVRWSDVSGRLCKHALAGCQPSFSGIGPTVGNGLAAADDAVPIGRSPIMPSRRILQLSLDTLLGSVCKRTAIQHHRDGDHRQGAVGQIAVPGRDSSGRLRRLIARSMMGHSVVFVVSQIVLPVRNDRCDVPHLELGAPLGGQGDHDRLAGALGDEGERAPPAPATPSSLRIAAPFVAPATCWWARILLPSIIVSEPSRVPSWAPSAWRVSRMRSHRPASRHRRYRESTVVHGPYRPGRSRQGAPVRRIQTVPLSTVR
jgi:hypothetical protein